MRKDILSYFLIIILFVKCNQREKSVPNQKTEIDHSRIKTEIDSINSILFDKSEMVKAFDDIYFGENEKIFKIHTKYYSIADIYFYVNTKFPNYKIDQKFGLYKFSLNSGPREDYSYCLKEINLINSVIESKYSKATEIISPPAPKKYSSLQKIEKELINSKNFPPPDDGYINYLYRYNKDNVTIMVGIRTEYIENKSYKNNEEIIEFKKQYSKVIMFSSDKILKLISDEIKQIVESDEKKIKESQNEAIKNDVEKF